MGLHATHLVVRQQHQHVDAVPERRVDLGFVPVMCMNSVLRVDTAVAALLAQLALLRRLE
jgi:hypothetical protein